MIRFDFALSEEEIAAMNAIPPGAWFTSVKFTNAESPAHPRQERLEDNNARKQATVNAWIHDVAAGRTVLDTFAANGAFSFEALRAGAKSVVGVELDSDRVAAANLVASFMRHRDPDLRLKFAVGDVYELGRQFDGPFDVTLCLGGLYHVADPPFVLRQLRAVTSEYLVVQTSSILRGRRNRNHAEFRVRGDATGKGLSSIVAGSGKWYMTGACFREMLHHAGFEVVDARERPPMFSALCRVM